jgi:signal transduction histidine kinase
MLKIIQIRRSPPARLALIGGVVVALWISFSLGFLESGSVGEGLKNTGKRLTLASSAIVTAIATLLVLLRLFARRLDSSPQGWQRSLGYYSVLIAAGLAGGLVRQAVVPVVNVSREDVSFDRGASVFGVVFATVLVGYLASLYADFIERIHTHERQLESQVEELKQSRHAITVAEERTRQEIAEFLHGSVQTKLLITQHDLAEIEESLPEDVNRAKGIVAKVRKDIEEVREQGVRRASHQLHPLVVNLGLAPAIRSLAHEFDGYLPVSVQMSPEYGSMDGMEKRRIEPRTRLAAYRIAEEALGNVHKHAGASRARVTLALANQKTLKLTVQDDGKGFDTLRTRSGMGLMMMRAKAEEVGGRVIVSSAPQKGTTVEVYLPLGSRAD